MSFQVLRKLFGLEEQGFFGPLISRLFERVHYRLHIVGDPARLFDATFQSPFPYDNRQIEAASTEAQARELALIAKEDPETARRVWSGPVARSEGRLRQAKELH